jgi:hypothetical protein
VIRKRLARISTVFTAATLALLLVGVAPAAAATPGWTASNAVPIPSTITAGKAAGYQLTLVNEGPGNISSLFLTSDTPGLVYVSDSRCNPDAPLDCSFGPLNVGDPAIVLVVAFSTVGANGSSFTASFNLKTNGDTISDGDKKKSRGDSFVFSATTQFTASTDKNSAGGFTVPESVVAGGTTIQNDQTVGTKNKQATTLQSLPANVPATLLDGPTNSAACTDTTHCPNAFGEWSTISVPSVTGQPFASPFTVVLTIIGSSVPGSLAPSEVIVLHTLESGLTEIIDQHCGTEPISAKGCLTATKSGNTWQIVVQLFYNGNLRGGW